MIKKVFKKLVVLLILSSAIGGFYYYSVNTTAEDDTLYYGEVELNTYDVYATTAGIVKDILVEVGDQVQPDQAVVVLDNEFAQIQYERSLLAQTVANEQIVKADTGAGEEAINMQSYNITQLENQKESLESSISGSWQLHKQSQLTSASLKAAYDLQVKAFNDLSALYEAGIETKTKVDQAALVMTNNKNSYDSSVLATSKLVNDIRSMESQVGAIEAQIASAEEGLKQLSGGYEDIDKNIVALGKDQAGLEVASTQYQLDQYNIKAYNKGVIDSIYYEDGEFVNMGSPVISLHDPEVMTVIIYVSENDLMKVEIGQIMDFDLVVDPTVVLSGSVTDIAREAMFTPVNIVTEKDRERLVFAVEVDLEFHQGVKSGMLLVTDISELE